MRRIWNDEAAEFHGEFVSFDPIWSWPKPIQSSGPKVLLGSRGRRCFDRVAEYCDGWMPLGSDRAQSALIEVLARLREACQRVGRPFDALELAVIGLDAEKEFCVNLLEAGFRHLIFSLAPLPAHAALVTLDSFAEFVSSLRN